MPSRLRTLAAAAALLLATRAGAQAPAVRVLTARQVPAGAVHVGRVEAARQWTDRAGENLLLLTRTDEVPSPRSDQPDERDRELHAYHYVRGPAGYRLLWQIVDFERECPWDVVLGFVPGSLQVTDVDRNGTAETAFAYRLGCRGGVDPSALKVIVHDGTAKYAIRGTGDMRHLGSGYPAPEMHVDPALQARPALRDLALRVWARAVREPAEPETGAP